MLLQSVMNAPLRCNECSDKVEGIFNRRKWLAFCEKIDGDSKMKKCAVGRRNLQDAE